MDQEPSENATPHPIFGPLQPLPPIENMGHCIGVRSSKDGIVAQIFTNRQLVLYKDGTKLEVSIDKDIQSLVWAHPQ